MITETINLAKAAAVIEALFPITEGPREAYGVLCLAIYYLNFHLSDEPIPIDQLVREVGQSLYSIQRSPRQ